MTTTDRYSGEYKTWYFAGHYDQAGSINTTDTIIPLGGTAVYSVNAVVNKDAVGPNYQCLRLNGNTNRKWLQNLLLQNTLLTRRLLLTTMTRKINCRILKVTCRVVTLSIEVTIHDQSTANIDVYR